MEPYCPLCQKVVAPFDRAARLHQGQRAHGACLDELERRFPKVMADEHPDREPVIFRRVSANQNRYRELKKLVDRYSAKK